MSDRQANRQSELDAAARIIAARLGCGHDQAATIAARLSSNGRDLTWRPTWSWRAWRARTVLAAELAELADQP